VDDLCDPAGIVAFRDGQLLHDWGLHPYPPRYCGGGASDPYYPRPSTHTLSTQGGSVANYRKQESLVSQVIDFPIHDFRILPRKGHFAIEPTFKGLG
jgi:hypothetical protein